LKKVEGFFVGEGYFCW